MAFDTGSIYAAPTPCGGTIAKTDYQATPYVRTTVELTQEQRQSYQLTLKAGMEKTLLSLLMPQQPRAKLDAAFSRALDSTIQTSAEFVVATYVMTNAAFHQRKQVCAQEDPSRKVLRSVTVIKATGETSSRLRTSLKAALQAEAELAALEANGGMDLDRIVDRVVASQVDGYSFAIALGFD